MDSGDGETAWAIDHHCLGMLGACLRRAHRLTDPIVTRASPSGYSPFDHFLRNIFQPRQLKGETPIVVGGLNAKPAQPPGGLEKEDVPRSRGDW